MINKALLNPKSIAVIGASNSLEKPGGGLVANLINEHYKGNIYPVNPKEKKIQGLECYNTLELLPQTDLAILAIPAHLCIHAVTVLSKQKNTKAFIIISAGFSEMGAEGKAMEQELKTLAYENELSIIGPNCIGVTNINYKAVFVKPPPPIVEKGIDFVTASGAFAVFLFETAALHGLQFGEVYTVGNSVCNGVEEVLAHWDHNYSPKHASKIKLVYVEQIRKPELFFQHIVSLREKGCHVIVTKPGDSEAGARAALSHTGALAGDADAFDMLIKKAGAIRCYSREEMVHIASILCYPELVGKNLAIITHAGGPAVMMSDSLQKAGFDIPEIDANTSAQLLEQLHPGASAKNPIDLLATANRDQLSATIKTCAALDYIDGLVVIYGKTGMEDLSLTYSKLATTIKENNNKPIYTIMPSVNSGASEIKGYIKYGLPTFFDEVVFANALSSIVHAPSVYNNELLLAPKSTENVSTPRALSEEETIERLRWCGIPIAQTEFVYSKADLSLCNQLNYPLVAKVVGILHKTEVEGVILNINNASELEQAFEKIKSIAGSKGMLVQEMMNGSELYLGAKMHEGIGYSVHAGVGGILIELLRDVQARLAPVNMSEAHDMIKSLKAQKLFSGFRNLTPISQTAFAQLICTFSQVFKQYPDIREIDLNPLIANGDNIIAVDARIII